MSELRPGDAVFSHRELVATWNVIQEAREILRTDLLPASRPKIDAAKRVREALRLALEQLDKVVLEERAAAAAMIDPEAPTEPARR